MSDIWSVTEPFLFRIISTSNLWELHKGRVWSSNLWCLSPHWTFELWLGQSWRNSEAYTGLQEIRQGFIFILLWNVESCKMFMCLSLDYVTYLGKRKKMTFCYICRCKLVRVEFEPRKRNILIQVGTKKNLGHNE